MSEDRADEQPREVVERLEAEVAALRRSRRRLAEAAYADRHAIERDLHDGVQQDLIALAVNLQRLAGLVDVDPLAAKALLGELASIVQEAIDETTELARVVHPPTLEGRGLASAIRAAAERAGVTVAIEVPAGVAYPPEIAAAVYWSCVDALSAAPVGSTASVRLQDGDDGVAFEISTAGLFPDGPCERLRDRVEALDGHVTVDGRHDGGADIQGWLPLSS
jgi:signal transduction histidine kinase